MPEWLGNAATPCNPQWTLRSGAEAVPSFQKRLKEDCTAPRPWGSGDRAVSGFGSLFCCYLCELQGFEPNWVPLFFRLHNTAEWDVIEKATDKNQMRGKDENTSFLLAMTILLCLLSNPVIRTAFRKCEQSWYSFHNPQIFALLHETFGFSFSLFINHAKIFNLTPLLKSGRLPGKCISQAY